MFNTKGMIIKKKQCSVDKNMDLLLERIWLYFKSLEKASCVTRFTDFFVIFQYHGTHISHLQGAF